MAEKKPQPVDISKWFDGVRHARDVAINHSPRLFKEATDEFCDHVAQMQQRGELIQHYEAGVIDEHGRNVEEMLIEWLKERPHAIKPKPIADLARETWLTEGGAPLNMTRVGQRLIELGGDVKALDEEAAYYGASRAMGTAGRDPDNAATKLADKAAAAEPTAGAKNPWSASFVGSDADRLSRMTDIMKRGGSFARDMARAAGTVVTKPLARRTKG